MKKNAVEVRHIQAVPLELPAFTKVIEKYSKKFEYSIIVVFDKRIKDCRGVVV